MGWFPISHRMAKDGSLSAGAKAVFMAIKAYYPNCHPGIELIASHAGLGIRTVWRKIKELEEGGYLKVERKEGGVNHYFMHKFPGDGGAEQLETYAKKYGGQNGTRVENGIGGMPKSDLVPMPKSTL